MTARLSGLVLVGGRSVRMREPKCDLVYRDRPQWQVARELLAPFCDDVFLSARSDQAFPSDIPVIRDETVDEGPLSGLRAAHRFRKDAAWLVLACDLPGADLESIEHLVRERHETREATAFGSVGRPEPLFAIWEPQLLARLRGRSPSALLRAADVEWVAPKREIWVRNINSPEERRGFTRSE